MSIRLMSRVFESTFPAMEKLVLLAMADHARDDGTGCYPSIATLARKTSLSERGVQKVIGRLKSKHLLTSRGKAKGGRGVTVEYDVTLEKGERCSGFRNEKGERECSKRVNRGAENPEQGSPESSGTVREPGAARIDQAKIQGVQPSDAVETYVQPATLFNEVKKSHRPVPAWVKGEIAEDLYRGIHHKKIAATFFDAQHLSPREQLAACVSVAVTSLVTARVARLKALSADEIERRAFEALLPGLTTLELVGNFDVRRSQTVQAVTTAVISVCVRMLKARAEGAA